MEINHDLLLSLGFTELFNRPGRYVYKGVTGHLMGDGIFHFHGFSPIIMQITDLKYMLMVIDYNYQATIFPYPYHAN